MVGQRCADIFTRLENATRTIFDAPSVNTEIDAEFPTWFDLGCQHREEPGQPTPSVGLPWHDWFDHGFDLDETVCPSLFHD